MIICMIEEGKQKLKTVQEEFVAKMDDWNLKMLNMKNEMEKQRIGDSIVKAKLENIINVIL